MGAPPARRARYARPPRGGRRAQGSAAAPVTVKMPAQTPRRLAHAKARATLPMPSAGVFAN